VQPLVERHDTATLILTVFLLLFVAATALIPLTLAPSSVADDHVELGDLVRILARSWNFDCAGPVEIIVAESE